MESKLVGEMDKVHSNGPDCTYQPLKKNPEIVLYNRPRKAAAKHHSRCCATLKICGLLTLAIFFFINLTGLIVYWATNLIGSSITQSMVIRNNSMQYASWTKQPAKPVLQVRIFNYTNVEEFLSGDDDKLRVEEIGPFAYSETFERVNVEFHENDTVSYQERRSYEYNQNASVGNLDDMVTVPNMAFLGTISAMKDSNYLMKFGISTMLRTLKVQPFVTVKINDYFWGYNDSLFDLAKNMPFGNHPEMQKKSGLLVAMNGTSYGRISIHTGASDITLLNVIDRYSNKDKLDYWGSDECNRLDGTDGTMFPRNLVKEDSVLHIYMRDMCRKFPLVFKEHVVAACGVPALRFQPPLDVFATPETQPDNACFCHPSVSCPPAGVFNASPCSFNAPVMFSFPHFYLGDPVLLEMVDGLKPNATKHGMFLDIQEFGFPVGGESRFQMNMMVRKSSDSQLERIDDGTILPIVWFEVVVDSLPLEVGNALQGLIFVTHTVKRLVVFSFLFTLFVVLIILISYGYRRYRNKEKRPPPVKDVYRQVSQITTDTVDS